MVAPKKPAEEKVTDAPGAEKPADDNQGETEPNICQTPPIIINMGKKKNKVAKKIKKGKGPVHKHVDRAVAYTVETMSELPENAVIVPVVLLYERKRPTEYYPEY